MASVATDISLIDDPFNAAALYARYEAESATAALPLTLEQPAPRASNEPIVGPATSRQWNPTFEDHLPGPNTFLRESLLPSWGRWGKVDWAYNIICQVKGPQIALVMAPYLQMNRKNFIDQIEIDIDSDFDLSVLEGSGLPQPRYLACRPSKTGDPQTLCRRPHAVWWLRVPVRKANPDDPRDGDAQRKKNEHWVEAIRQTLIRRLRELGMKVDPKRPGLGKNPHHDHWRCVPGAHRDWTLGELTNGLGGQGKLLKKHQWTSREIEFEEHIRRVLGKQSLTHSTANPKVLEAGIQEKADARKLTQRYLAGQGRYDRYFDAERASQGRNCFVFEAIRGAVYSAKCSHRSREALVDFAHKEGRVVNEGLSRPLGCREVFGIAKSVGGWTWEHFATILPSRLESVAPCNRGICRRLGLIGSDQKGRVVAGRYAAASRALGNYERVQQAKERWTASGQRLNASAIARELGLNRETVSKYLDTRNAPQPLPAANLNRAPSVEEFVREKVSNTVSIKKEGGFERRVRPSLGWYDPSIPDDFEVIDHSDSLDSGSRTVKYLDAGHLKLLVDNQNCPPRVVSLSSPPNVIVMDLQSHRVFGRELKSKRLKKSA